MQFNDAKSFVLSVFIISRFLNTDLYISSVIANSDVKIEGDFPKWAKALQFYRQGIGYSKNLKYEELTDYYRIPLQLTENVHDYRKFYYPVKQ